MDEDHTAKLIAYTQDAGNSKETMLGPELLAFFARVSNTANQGNHKTGAKLIASLIRRKEWSPLDMVNLVFEIHSTRDIGRQILRHWSIHPQEFSQRYAEVTAPPIFTEARKAHPTDRQKSVVWDDPEIQAEWLQDQQHIWNTCVGSYQYWLGKGMAKEVARKLLPEGLTPTDMYMNGTLRSWIHYCMLRCENKTQKEHRHIANQIWDQLHMTYPKYIPKMEELVPPEPVIQVT